MAIEPSPTAEATRLMLPLRTSPIANTPGRLVSSRYGDRGKGQPAPARSSGESCRSGLDESLVIEHHTAIEPVRVWHCAGHHEHVRNVECLDVSGSVVAHADALDAQVAFERDDLGLRA